MAQSLHPRRICLFTGSRAEYGLLSPLMKEIAQDDALSLQLVVSGSHLEKAFGETWRQIEADGFRIDAKVDMQLHSDRPVDVAKSMSVALAGCAEAFERLRPDIVVLLGDRYETLAAAQAALLLRLPIAHIHGGERTEGAIDDAMRHAITKMAHLHFAATEEYRRRILQLGEQPERVFTVGAPGIDTVATFEPMPRAQLEQGLGIRFRARNLLVTYHPETLADESPAAAIQELLSALDRFPDLGIVITKSNADVGGREINALMEGYAAQHAGRVAVAASLGQRRYLSVMGLVDAVVGNSSSGIIEAPAMGKPNVNIGKRQDGRIRAPGNIDCAAKADAIAAAIERALSPSVQELAARKQSPYGAGGASRKIKQQLAAISLDTLLHKQFRDLH